jgi:hypothetical protein
MRFQSMHDFLNETYRAVKSFAERWLAMSDINSSHGSSARASCMSAPGGRASFQFAAEFRF